MEYLALILLLIAYTLGIVTIIMQILCLKKDIEYKETILFTSSFLLLIIVLIVAEFFLILNIDPGKTLEIINHFVYILLACTTPLSIHTERVVSNKVIRNKLAIVLSILLSLSYAISYIFTRQNIIENVIYIFLFVSIVYSMILIIIAKPTLLLLHREKVERKSAIIIIAILASMLSLEIINAFKPFLNDKLFKPPIIISVIAIYLTLTKLFDDFQRLSLFTVSNTFNTDKLAYFNITEREAEVLDLLIKGSTYKDIAGRLFISLPTVKTHVSNIYQKMDVNNKIELINLINS